MQSVKYTHLFRDYIPQNSCRNWLENYLGFFSIQLQQSVRSCALIVHHYIFLVNEIYYVHHWMFIDVWYSLERTCTICRIIIIKLVSKLNPKYMGSNWSRHYQMLKCSTYYPQYLSNHWNHRQIIWKSKRWSKFNCGNAFSSICNDKMVFLHHIFLDEFAHWRNHAKCNFILYFGLSVWLLQVQPSTDHLVIYLMIFLDDFYVVIWRAEYRPWWKIQ